MKRDEMTRGERLALRPREAAECLGISERLLRELTKGGLVPHVRLGPSEQSRLLYPVAALERWLLERSGMAEQGDGGAEQ